MHELPSVKPGCELPAGSQAADVALNLAPDVARLTPQEQQMLQQLQGQFANLRLRRLIDEGASSQVRGFRVLCVVSAGYGERCV